MIARTPPDLSPVDVEDRYRPSFVFWLLLGVTVALGVVLWRGVDIGDWVVFAFVLAGWTLSLTLHEFGHALVAYVSGDKSVAAKGYLTLDVRRYADPFTSLAIPLFFLVAGGIGLPGGAVWINHGAIPDKVKRSLVSAAGPFATFVCAVACLVPIQLGLLDGADSRFVVALGFLGWIQVIALLFNLIPLPGLDGFGIIDPHLSPEIRRQIRPLRQYGFMILIGLLWFVEPVGDAFFGVTDSISTVLGGSDADLLRSLGWNEFRFWERL